MKKVDIKENLFNVLLEDYEAYKDKKDYQNQFQTGIDFFEAVIKFFGILNISLVKQIDKEVYKKIVAANFKEKPSLGDFKSLATAPFTKQNSKSLKGKNNEFYKFLEKIFKEKNKLSLHSINSIKGEENKEIEKNTLFDLFEGYLVTFRNQLKGHSASFRARDEKEKNFVEKVISSIDKIVNVLKVKLYKLLEKVEFYEDNYKLIAKHKNYEVNILPLMIYIPCNKYSCCQDNECNDKRVRIFFFNDKTNEKIYYLDYGYNHFYNLKNLADENLINEVNEFFKNLNEYKKELNFKEYVNNEAKHKRLLENFVGREEELKILKDHINSSNASFSYVVGKPGIGKSALMAKLVDELKKDKNINTLIFYSKSSDMGGDKEAELKTIYFKIEELIKDTLNNKNLKIESQIITDKFDKLFKEFEEKSQKPVLIIIDGLDEFKDYKYIVDSIPFNFSEKIHFIFTSRDYDSMIDHISNKVANYTSSINILTTTKENQTKYYLKLKRLSDDEVEELINIALPKEVRKREDYEEIIKIIIDKSESLPLYLDYLISILKEKNISLEEFKEWTKKLPKGIDEFYRQSFKKASQEAMNILYLLYFSFNAQTDELNIIFEELEIIKDNQQFDKIFNEIEIFLEEENGYYTFYHQSVKDAIEKFLIKKRQLCVLDNKTIEKILYFNPNQKIIYLNHKLKSGVFKFLEKVINFLKTDQDLNFYTKNFFHLYYQYINFKLLQSMLTINDIKNKNYSSILNHTKLNEEIKNLINDFLTLFDKKQEKYLFEIRYAYNLAFLIEDYKRVLKYFDEYQNYLYDKFLDIALNIEKKEKIKEFIELKEDWINNIPQNLKDFYIDIISKKEKLPNEFVEVMEFLDDEYKAKLIGKIEPEKALEVALSIEDDQEKSEALAYIAKKTGNKKLFDKSLEVALSIDYEKIKIEILNFIKEIDKKENLNKYTPIVENPLTKEYLAESFDISNTLDVVAELSYEDVLEYFGIEVEKERYSIDELLEKTKEKIKNIQKPKPKFIKEKKKILNETKKQILTNEKLFKEFLEKYGRQFDINNKEEFEEYFNDVFEEIIKLKE